MPVRLICANHSAYPRLGDSPESQRLRRAYTKRETGELDDEGYLEIARDYAAEIMQEQADAGCDVVTDGQVHHYDLVSHFAEQLGGTQRGGLIRFFDTNYLVRQPEIIGELTGTFGLAADYEAAAEQAPKPVKAVITGPYTLARHSVLAEGSPYPDVPSLTKAYAERLADSFAELAGTGCELVQIEEPSLLKNPMDAGVVRRALEVAVARKGGMRTSLVTYFGDATLLFEELVEMPVDMLGFDLVYASGLAELIADRGFERPVAIGAIDGRNTMPDDVDEVARTADRVMEALSRHGVDEVHLQPSCALEYLPRDRAKRKLERLREAADRIERVGA